LSVRIRFGDAAWDVELGPHLLLEPAATEAAVDPALAIQAALSAPLGFPALSSAVVPGDRVAIALGRNVPQVASVLKGAIASLASAGIERGDITVVSAEPFEETPGLVEALAAEGVLTAVHDPNNADAIAMVGLTAKHEPLRLNRVIAEADFVLPISTARTGRREGGPAKFGGLFPRFSNTETLDRFHGRGKTATTPRYERRVAETDEAGWLLGIGMVVVVTPGRGGDVAGIIAGEPGAASHAGAEQFQSIWERAIDERGDLVVATLAGGAEQQSWSNIAHAVAASEKMRSGEGSIAICCEIDDVPGKAFDALVDVIDYANVVRRLHDRPAEDAKAALALAQSLERGPVYLYSRLPAELVESWGVTPIADEAELTRLAHGRRLTIVIEEAQRLRPRYTGPMDEL
jgi:nickel-dependent lactate racemase